ncbi:MAG: amidohydrolase family protein [Colwellia sp.]|nr:amidohydrolase family protein [Colwellia sp.]
MKIIDPHLHLFNLEQGDYQWLKAENPPHWLDKKKIVKNFTEKDLRLPSPFELAGFVHIEAGFNNQEPWREIHWLESHCTLPFKSIAGIDLQLEPSMFLQAIIQLKKFKSVVGVRDILDDNAIHYLSNPQVQKNLALLAKEQLIFELQMPLNNLDSVYLLAELLAEMPQLSVVINHAGWPPQQKSEESEECEHQRWLQGIKILSAFEHCAIKCSGYEMTNRQYTSVWQQNIIKHCISCFGIKRVMLASNFPLCTFHSSYQAYWQQQITTASFSTDELAKLCHHNTERIYSF